MFKLRGYFALIAACLALLLLDPIQRFFVAPYVRLRPARRIPVLGRWQRLLAWVMLRSVSVLGGARIPELPKVPGRADTLVLMNHQSLMDIPLVVASIPDAYPRIVTRKRYLRWIPLISHMVRLYQYPVVDPAANARTGKRMLRSIADAARTTDVPLAIFPEGTRTRDGEIGRFKTTGLKLILEQRAWTVYVIVADGFWQRAKLKHFLGGMADIRGQIEMIGPFAWEGPGTDPEAFIHEIRTRMVDKLAQMRAASAAA